MSSQARQLLCMVIKRAAYGLGHHFALAINPAACQSTLHSQCQPTNLMHFSTLNTILSQHTAKQRTLTNMPRCARSIWTSVCRAAPPSHPRTQAQQRKSSEQGLYLVALIVGMVGLTYASVPLYRLFCQATGYGGTVQQGRTVEAKLKQRMNTPDPAMEAAAAEREITVYFTADAADGMPWQFRPTQRMVKIRPGQSTLAFYTAHNPTDKAITGVSTYNVNPAKAGYYFNKIQCFCFEEQKLRPGEKIDMPVFFYVDPEFATDPRLKGVDNLTLSYTFFKVDEDKETPQEALARILAAHPDQHSELLPRPHT